METIVIKIETGLCSAEITPVTAIDLGGRIVNLDGTESLSEISEKIKRLDKN